MVLSICGAVLFSSSVAPTEEILKIAVVSSQVHLLLMVLVSLLISFVILFFSDFRNAGNVSGGIREVFLHILIGYIATLVVSFILLWFFGRIGGNGFDVILAQIIVLAIPASIGASAGRLLIG